MCKLLQFPSPDDPRPEPPASAPRPGERSLTDAVSGRVLAPLRDSAPCNPTVAMDGVA